MDFELIQYFPSDVDYSFLKMNKDQLTVTLEPLFRHIDGVYDRFYIRFFFIYYPELQKTVRIIATILPCEFQSIRFEYP